MFVFVGVAGQEDEVIDEHADDIDDEGDAEVDDEGDADVSDEDEDGKIEPEDDVGDEPAGPQSTDADTVSFVEIRNDLDTFPPQEISAVPKRMYF